MVANYGLFDPMVCPTCGKRKTVRVSRTQKNPGRQFAKCFNCDDGFVWLDTIVTPTKRIADLEREADAAEERGFNLTASQLRDEIEQLKRQLPLGKAAREIMHDIDTRLEDKYDMHHEPIKEKEQSCNAVTPNVGERSTSELNEPKSTTSPDPSMSVVGAAADTSFLTDASEKSPTSALSFLSDDEPIKLTEDEFVAAPSSKPFTPSKYQEAIFDFVKLEQANAVVEAVAGSGKTTTLVKALEFTPRNQKVAFVAFNKHIATELQKRAPDHVHVSTLHSLGFSNIRKMMGKVQVDDHKLWNIFNQLTDGLPDMTRERLQENASAMIRLVNLLKGTLRQTIEFDLDYLCDRYGIEVNGDKDTVYEFVEKLFYKSVEDYHTIDFEDMIYACAHKDIPCERFDILFVDESQDLNAAQIKMAQESGARIICCGDSRQAIYGFRGSDTEAIANLTSSLKASTLPLSICYRCPKSVVTLAKTIVPQIEWREDAPDGVIKNISEPEMYKMLGAGDLILCRTNAPLVRPCFELIRRGVKATIRGRDIGKGLTELLDKHSKKAFASDLRSILYALSDYVEKECSKLIAVNKGTRAQTLQDQMETLIALADGCNSVSDVRVRIQKIFTDEQASVTFSSIHRSKGDESNRVFIMRPDLLPHPLAKQPWEQAQESNLRYVAITRSKDQLYFVQS